MARSRRRRIAVFLALVAPAFVSAGLLVVSAVPAQAIIVESRSPIPGEEVVPVGTNVSVTFDVAAMGVDASTFTLERTVGGVSVPATVTGSGSTWTLNPNADLQPGVTYTASLKAGITDVASVALAAESWDFTTTGTPSPPADTTAPTVTNRNPASGATGVSTLVTVSATFGEAVQGVAGSTFTLERTTSGVEVPAVVFQRGTSNTWSLNPDSPLLDGTSYTVRLTGGVAAIRDLADNPLADTSWSFRTGGGVDTVGPQVLSRFPRPGSTGVNRLTEVRVRFSESVRRVNDATFTLTDTRTGDEVLATVSRLGGSRQWVLEPDRTLRRGTRYLARLSGGAAGIQDLSGNALRSTTWSFRTRF
jgi:Bacterial Ig-like domain